jgi:hypothetical protein
METLAYVPCSKNDAALILRLSFHKPVERLSREEFVNVWHAIAYLYPGLHPDGYDEPDSGWPRVLKRFAAEAWARFHADELTDEELYPCEAAWCRIYDEMGRPPTVEENRRRIQSAAWFGLPLCAP